jgi:glutamate--cysteine ligase
VKFLYAFVDENEFMKSPILDVLKNHPRSQNRWIGLEVERLIQSNGKFLHFKDAMEPFLKSLVAEKKWAVDYQSDGHILGLKKSLHAISLEPGAQFEVSAAPRANLFEVKELEEKIDAEVFSLSMVKNWKLVEIGVNPAEHEDSIELLPSPRYRLMDAYFQKSGKRGRQMMRLTTGLQINLDFSSEVEAISMFRAAFRVVPVLATLFSNSPYLHGSYRGALSERHKIWSDTDPKRSGFLDIVFDEAFDFEMYVEHITKVPLMYYFDAEDHAVDPNGSCYQDLPQSLGAANALAALRQIFTEVRFKPCCVELRCFDQLAPADRMAASAMTVGLLYDEENRERLANLFRGKSAQDLGRMMDAGSERGLKAEGIYPLALDFLSMAAQGLERRKLGEEIFLKPVEEIIRTTETPAERWLRTVGEKFQ